MTKTFLDLYMAISDALKARMEEETKARDRHRAANNQESVWISVGRTAALVEALGIVREEFEKVE